MQIERILSRFEIPKEQGRIASVVDFDFERITVDLDQVSAWSEVPAKEKFFLKTGLDYRDRKIDKLQALAAWASEDGFDFNSNLYPHRNPAGKRRPYCYSQKCRTLR